MLMALTTPVIFNRHHTTAGGGAANFFTDSFTGANGSSPNARWNQLSSTWTIQNNRLENTGASYGEIVATSGIGDQTFTWDMDFSSAGSTFAEFIIRWVDTNNCLFFVLDASDILHFKKFVAGVTTDLQTDSVTRCGSGAGPCSGKIVISGNNISMQVIGGAQTPGTFGPFVEPTHAATGQAVGFGINVGKSGDYFDNVSVDTP